MVVDDFNVSGAGTSPSKADSPLVIDSHAELTRPVALERFQTIAWNVAQIGKRRGGVEMIQFPLRNRSNCVGDAGAEVLCRVDETYHDTLAEREESGLDFLGLSDVLWIEHPANHC